MAIAGFGILFSIGTLLVKITDDNAKEGTSSKALNIEIGFYYLQQSLLLFLSTIHAPVTMKMEFLEGSQDISSMRVFYATLIGLS
jgi:K(+)-stimulated pyrophosphate-energized sodium pump